MVIVALVYADVLNERFTWDAVEPLVVCPL